MIVLVETMSTVRDIVSVLDVAWEEGSSKTLNDLIHNGNVVS